MRKVFLAALLAATAMPASGAVVASSLPYPGTPDWRTVIFDGTSMVHDGSSTTLTTAQGRGVWFGWTPGATSWSPNSLADGNAIDLTARFSSDARDWNTYFAIGGRIGSILYNPTGCDGNAQDCTFAAFASGVSLSFAATADGMGTADRFVALDTTQAVDFGLDLKDNMVRYRINGVAYTGYAQGSGTDILVIGDGSGSTLTGWGSMTVTAAAFDNGPIAAIPAVPEPATWALMIAGLGLAGTAARRRSTTPRALA